MEACFLFAVVLPWGRYALDEFNKEVMSMLTSANMAVNHFGLRAGYER